MHILFNVGFDLEQTNELKFNNKYLNAILSNMNR